MITFFDLITSIWAQRFLQKSNALPRNFTEIFRIKQRDDLLKRKDHHAVKIAIDQQIVVKGNLQKYLSFLRSRTFNKITSTNDKAQ